MDNNQFVTPPKRNWKFEHSKHVSDRKRALFPSQDSDSDSDLGLLSPLENSSSPEKYESLLNVSKHDNSDFRYFTFFDKFKKTNDENCQPENSFSPILSSPDKNNLITTIKTPTKSPSSILKTPHDNNSTNMQVPRLVRKSLLDISNIDKTSLKRKSDSPEEICNKSFKLDHSAQKPPKARTALFTENESCVSAKSFYGNTDSNKIDHSFRSEFYKTKHVSRKPNPVYLCNRGRNKNNKRGFGQINAGVRHGIRKPKRKPTLTKTQLLKAALNIVKNSPLNDILDDFNETQVSSSSSDECGVSLEQIKKMDSILKNMESTEVKPLTSFSTHEIGIPKESYFGVKRCLSPERDTKRKFFKSGPSSRATISITDNITLKLDKGELSLIEKESKIWKPKDQIIDFDISDLSIPEEKIIDESFTDILKSLEDDKIVDAKDVILSPTSLVCDLTSGLALDSPKSQTQTSEADLKKATFKKRIYFPEVMEKEQKLFPIFYGKQNNPKPPPEKKESRHVKNIRKIWKPLSEDQTLIDAGQKKFGVTQCPECKVMYSMGEPEDEIMHYNYHNNISVFRYNTWKNERVVNQFYNGKVIQVNPHDPKNWWKKVKEVLEVVNRELGFVDDAFLFENKKVFLCIVNKQIVGCLVAEPKLQAHKLIPSSDGIDLCSEESYPVKCGVSRIWVAQHQRKKGIATCMMNAMRSHFMYGHILSSSDIAFSAPTDAGKKFAEKYTNNSTFLLYTS